MKFMFDKACYFRTKGFLFEKRGHVCVCEEESNFTTRKDTEDPLLGYLPLFYCNECETSPTDSQVLNFPVLPQKPDWALTPQSAFLTVCLGTFTRSEQN